MATETTSNKMTFVARCALLKDGVQALPDADLLMGSKTYAKSTVVAVLDAYLNAHTATAAAKVPWTKAVVAEKAALADARDMRALLRVFFQNRLGASSPDLTKIGFEPRKVPKVPVKTKAAAADKTVATRKARHTMGKVQKKDIKGTPATAAPGASPAPAPAAASAAPAAKPAGTTS